MSKNFAVVKTVFTLLFFGSSLAEANPDEITPNSWIFAQLNSRSIATKKQILIVQRIVIREAMSAHPYEKTLEIINAKLHELALPTIQANAKVNVVKGNGILPSIEGASFEDGAYKFCLPCQTGWNQYEVGIFPISDQKD